jgi:hypothetical protein
MLAFVVVRRPHQETPSTPAAAERDTAPRIALAPSEPQQGTGEAPPAQIVERQGPKLIERMLAEKFGTPPAKPPVAAPRTPEPPAPPQAAEKPPQVEEKPPLVIATAPPRLTQPLTSPRPAAGATAAISPPTPERPAAKPAAKPEPKSQAITKPEPRTAKRQAAPTPERQARKPETATRPEPEAPKPARVEERPVVVASTEVARPVEAAGERQPTAVIERPVAVPVATQRAVVASAADGEPPPVEAERVAAVVPTAPAHPSGPSHDAVRGLLDRYAAAWRRHDVDTLRAIGQVTNDGQANALRQYFASVRDLEVEVRVLDIRSDGNRATVRFTRRDTFRDPTGREIAKESPPIEKDVVTTPQGLRFAPAS